MGLRPQGHPSCEGREGRGLDRAERSPLTRTPPTTMTTTPAPPPPPADVGRERRPRVVSLTPLFNGKWRSGDSSLGAAHLPWTIVSTPFMIWEIRKVMSGITTRPCKSRNSPKTVHRYESPFVISNQSPSTRSMARSGNKRLPAVSPPRRKVEGRKEGGEEDCVRSLEGDRRE